MSRIELGDLVKDTVTGFQGVAIGRTEWLHGCERIIVQPKVGKDGKLGENGQFDEPQLDVVKAKVSAKGNPKKGGFSMMATQRTV